MSLVMRLLGGLITGGAAYAGLWLFAPDMEPAIVVGITAAMTIAGLAFGPKAWELVTQIL